MNLMKRILVSASLICMHLFAYAQNDSVVAEPPLRIINFNAYFTQHIDSVNVYQFRINKDSSDYFWYLRNAPVGLSINKNTGVVTYKAAKNYFLTGRLKYDFPYKVGIGIQSLSDPADKLDTSFSISFYNTEIIPSQLKPSVSGLLTVQEGETLSFNIQCETGSLPFDAILFSSSIPLRNYSTPKECGDVFTWTPDFDFVKETDSARTKIVQLQFIGSTKSSMRDTVSVRIAVKDALNYPVANETYYLVQKNIKLYVLQLKYAFLQLDKKLRKVKTARTAFDLTAASTALTGTILNTSSSDKAQRTGKILPSVGLVLTPIKEAAAPNKTVEQNQAALIRTTIKRLEYMLQDNELIGEKDPDILTKTAKLKDELKQAQVQLIDIPVDISNQMSEEELNRYFNSPKVNKKYRLRRK
jgi:hypothetical protein